MIIDLYKFAVSEVLAKIAPFLTTLYVAKFLSPELFGKYSLVIVMFEIIFILISFNIQATTRIDFFKETESSFSSIKQNHITITFIILGFFSVSLFFLETDQRFLLLLLLACALLRTFSVFIMAIFQCSKKVNSYVFSNIIFVLVLSIFIFMFVNLGMSYLSWIYSMFIASTVQLIVVINLFGGHSFKKYLPKKIAVDSLKKTLIPAALFMPQALGWWLKSGAERIIISDSLGNVVLGVYALAVQFASITFMYVTILNLALVPEINKLIQRRNFEEMHKYLLMSSFSIIIICALIGILGFFVIDQIYSYDYILAKNYLPFLLMASLPQAIMLIYINVLYFNKEGKFVATLVLASFSIQTMINFFLIDHFGIYGVIGVSLIINTIALFFVINKIRGLKLGTSDKDLSSYGGVN
jgi:O-antigen/teichoic acid export membrane protein